MEFMYIELINGDSKHLVINTAAHTTAKQFYKMIYSFRNNQHQFQFVLNKQDSRSNFHEMELYHCS